MATTAKRAAKPAAKPVEMYALRCPRSGEIRYIGKANDSQKRLNSHMRSANRDKVKHFPVYCWINSLTADGLLPVITVEAIAIGDWRILERQLIEQHRKDGTRLLNVADGGDMPLCSVTQRRLNGIEYNIQYKSDPIKRALRHLLNRLGQTIRSTRKSGNEVKAQKYQKTLDKFRAVVASDRDQVFVRLLANPILRNAMGVDCV